MKFYKNDFPNWDLSPEKSGKLNKIRGSVCVRTNRIVIRFSAIEILILQKDYPSHNA